MDGKRTYTAPSLKKLGTLAQITMSVTEVGATEPGPPVKNNKT